MAFRQYVHCVLVRHCNYKSLEIYFFGVRIIKFCITYTWFYDVISAHSLQIIFPHEKESQCSCYPYVSPSRPRYFEILKRIGGKSSN